MGKAGFKMKKICGNCGAELKENAKFCGNCGTKVFKEENINTEFSDNDVDDDVYDDNDNTADTETTAANKGGKGSKRKGIIAGAAAAVVIAVILLAVFISSMGSRGFLKKTMSAVKNCDIDFLVENTSDVMYELLASYGYNEEYLESFYENAVGNNIIDYFENNVGHSYKFSYEIEEIYTATDRQLEKRFAEYSDNIRAFAEEKVKKMVIAEVEIEAEKNNRDESVDLKIYMTKENGSWKLYDIIRD